MNAPWNFAIRHLHKGNIITYGSRGQIFPCLFIDPTDKGDAQTHHPPHSAGLKFVDPPAHHTKGAFMLSKYLW